MLVLNFLVVQASSLRLEDSVILASSFTPESLKELCYGLNSITLDKEFLSPAIEQISSLDFLFLVDFTYSQSFNAAINSLSEYFKVSYLSIFNSNSTSPYRIELHTNLKKEANSILSLFSSFNLTSFAIITSSNVRDLELASYLKAVSSNDFFSYSDNISLEYAENFVLKILKSSGVNSVILIDSSESSSKFEKAIVNKNWMKIGTIIINSARTPNKIKTIGTLQVCESGTEGFFNAYEFHFKAISNFVQVMNKKLQKTIKSGEMTRSVLLQKAKEFKVELNIVNFQPEARVVGEYNAETKKVVINSRIVFPGNTTDVKAQQKSLIVLSIANGTNDPYYSFSYDLFAYFFQGANYAVYRSNLFNEIPNFEIKLSPNDCGIFWYDAYWYYNCFSKLTNKMGVGLITSFFGDAIKGNAFTLRALNKVIPQVSPLGMDDEIDEIEKFPELVKLEASSKFYILSRFFALINLGFKDLIIIASNDTENINTYLEAKELLEISGMNIVNDENSRFVDYYYHRENFSVYEDMFKRIKNTYCTVFYILTFSPEYILEAFYDIGLRKGEFFMFRSSSLIHYLTGVEEPYFTKRKELVQGALVFSYREWMGTLGIKLQNELSEKYSELTYMCMTYDTVSVFKEAIKYILSIGEDIENYSILMKAIRLNRFIGCLGNVFFSNGGNSRSSAQILIQQIYYNESLMVLETKDVAYYDRLGTQLLTQLNQYVWPDGKHISNYRPMSECGFEPKEEQNSLEGKKVLYVMCVVLFVVGILSGVVCIRSNRQEIKELVERKIISFGDMTFYAYFALEFFQIIAMGPEQDAYSQTFGNLQFLISFELNYYFLFKSNKFWMLFYGVFSVSLLYVFICFSRLTNFEVFIPSLIKEKYQIFANFILMFSGYLLFVPTISMLLNIFTCYKATGDDLSDSFLDQDCKNKCYTGNHKKFAILTGLLLSTFIGFSTFYKPNVQYLNSSQNTKTKPKFFVFQTWIQLTLVILNKVLKVENQTTHGIIFIIILFGYLIGTYLMRPYNFKRPIIAHCFFIIAALWSVFTSVLFQQVGSMTAWVAVEFSGLGVIMIIGIITFKRSEEMLYSVKGRDISTLFLFQFLKNYEKYVSEIESEVILRENQYKIENSREHQN